MTAHAMTQDVQKSFAAGMNGHIAKPFDPAGLETLLKRWIIWRKPGGAPPVEDVATGTS
jgi:two-component system sensor histidine kinase/response regulator